MLPLCPKGEQCSIVRGDVEMVLGVSQSTAILLLQELTDDAMLGIHVSFAKTCFGSILFS